MLRLKIAQAYTVLRLGQDEDQPTSLLDQALPHLGLSSVLILDVEGLRFTSLQIGEIVRLGNKFDEQWKNAPHRIAIMNLSDEAREVFAITRLDAVFKIFETLGDALKELQ